MCLWMGFTSQCVNPCCFSSVCCSYWYMPICTALLVLNHTAVCSGARPNLHIKHPQIETHIEHCKPALQTSIKYCIVKTHIKHPNVGHASNTTRSYAHEAQCSEISIKYCAVKTDTKHPNIVHASNTAQWNEHQILHNETHIKHFAVFDVGFKLSKLNLHKTLRSETHIKHKVEPTLSTLKWNWHKTLLSETSIKYCIFRPT